MKDIAHFAENVFVINSALKERKTRKMTELMWFSAGWFSGGVIMWRYFVSQKLIRNKEEWMKAHGKSTETC